MNGTRGQPASPSSPWFRGPGFAVRATGCPLPLCVWAGALALCVCASARADSVWEVLPYRVRLVVAVEPGPDWGPETEARLARELLGRCDAVIGAVWDAEAAPAPAALARKMIADLEAVAVDDLPAECLDLDKVLLLAVRVRDGGYEAVARELDVRTRVFGSAVRRPLRQPAKLRDVCFAAAAAAFCPLARIDHPKDSAAVLRPRGAALPRRDGTPDWTAPGAVFRAVVRRNDRDGKLSGLTHVPWTFLVVERAGQAGLECRIHSGLRGPLSSRRRGRIEVLALAVVAPEGPTVLALESRAEPRRPLAGYDVLAHAPGSRTPELLGRTDLRGEITVRPGAGGLRLLVVVSGGAPLARLPLVPGLAPRLTAYVPDDDDRMEAEGFVAGVQEQLVDLVARREVLLARARNRLETGRTDEAKALLEQLEALKRTRDSLEQELTAREKANLSGDPAVRSKIEALLSDAKKLLAQHMDDRVLLELSKQLLQARAGKP